MEPNSSRPLEDLPEWVLPNTIAYCIPPYGIPPVMTTRSLDKGEGGRELSQANISLRGLIFGDKACSLHARISRACEHPALSAAFGPTRSRPSCAPWVSALGRSVAEHVDVLELVDGDPNAKAFAALLGGRVGESGREEEREGERYMCIYIHIYLSHLTCIG
ncbi:hypothetical protein VTO42DRAFT_2133 [Malbranchea cinnamomea]